MRPEIRILRARLSWLLERLAFRINKSGPCCLSTILRCTDLTGHQPACASAP